MDLAVLAVKEVKVDWVSALNPRCKHLALITFVFVNDYFSISISAGNLGGLGNLGKLNIV